MRERGESKLRRSSPRLKAGRADATLTARVLHGLDELGRVTDESPELEHVARLATAVLKDALELDYVAIAAVHADRGTIEQIADASSVGMSVPRGFTVPIDRGLVGRCVREGCTVFAEDVRSEPSYVETVPGIVTEVVVPVLSSAGVIAVLVCNSKMSGKLGDRIALLEVAAHRLGVALENAQLLRERASLFEALSRKARELEVLNEIARIATRDLELYPMLQRITDAMARKFGFEFVACVTVDRAAGVFECQAVSTTVPTDVHVGYRRALGSGVVGEVAATGRALLLDDVRTHANYVETLPGALAELCVPVHHGGELIAILNLESRRLGRFRDQLPLLETVAEQVASAIASARLYEETLDANRTMKHIFARYVAPDLADTLLRDPKSLESRGERRDVSLLFADVRGFTRISERLESERVLELLNELYAALADGIFTEGGSINRFLGDGLMAVFGVPRRLDRHAEHAVAAARAIQTRIVQLAPRWIELAGEPLRVVVAVNSGEAIAGSLGDPRHMEFTVVGDTVNVAARLETEAKARDVDILVSGATFDALADERDARPLGEIALRGREARVRIFALGCVARDR